MRESSFWNLWPEIDNRTAAIKASRQGVLAASLGCIFTVLIALATLLVPARGFSLYSLIDAVIFGIIAWRIYRLSFSWAIFGLAFFVCERVDGVLKGTPKLNVVGWLIAGLFLVCYMNTVRATYFLRKHKEIPTDLSPSPPSPAPSSSSPSESENAVLLNQLKEELFSLESQKISGVLSREEYEEAIEILQDRMKRVLFPRQHRENTIDLPTEDRVAELFQTWQQGGKEGLRKAYQKEGGEVTPAVSDSLRGTSGGLMGRALSSVCMAFCGVIGVLILFNVCTQLPGVLLRATKTGTYDAAFWESIVVDLIGAAFATAFLTGAFFLRRHLKTIDAKVEDSN